MTNLSRSEDAQPAGTYSQQAKYFGVQAADVRRRKPTVEYTFARDSLEQASAAIENGLKVIASRCTWLASSGAYDAGEVAAHYEAAGDLHDLHTALMAGWVDADLYALAEAIRLDLGTKHRIVLGEGRAFQSRPLKKYLADARSWAFKLEKQGRAININVKAWRKTTDQIVAIDIPKADRMNPFAWLVLAHEFMHYWNEHLKRLRRELAKRLIPTIQDRNARKLIDAKLEECLADLLALLYVGPAYAKTVSDVLARSHVAPSESHPAANVRWAFIGRALDWMKNHLPDDVSTQTRDLALKMVDAGLREIREVKHIRTLEPEENAIIEFFDKNVEAVMELVANTLARANSKDLRWEYALESTFHNHLPFREAPTTMLKEIGSLMAGGFQLAIDPRVLYNFALLELPNKNGNEQEFREGLLYSFRKWLVVRQIDKSPELRPRRFAVPAKPS